jgi:hypothetical protein
VREEIIALSQAPPRHSYRRITALLRRAGWEVNPKRVGRVRPEEGLKVSKRQRKMRRVGPSTATRQRAIQPNHVWSWDFVEDQTERGSKLRTLTLIEEYMRQCLAVHVAWSIPAVDVITVVEGAMERYGAFAQRQRAGIHRLCHPGLAQRQTGEGDLYQAGFSREPRLDPLTDDHFALDVHQVEHAADGVARRLVRLFLLAFPQPLQRVKCGQFPSRVENPSRSAVRCPARDNS